MSEQPKKAWTADEFRVWVEGDRLDLIIQVGTWLENDRGGGVFDGTHARMSRAARFMNKFRDYSKIKKRATEGHAAALKGGPDGE